MHKKKVMQINTIFILLLLAGALNLTGCTAARLEPSAWQDQNLRELVWPRPPETERIRLLRVISGPNEITPPDKGMIKKIANYFLGEDVEQVGFYTPHCMAADGYGLLFVADPSLGVVHRYDLGGRSVSYIHRAGDRNLVSPVGVALDRDGNLYVTDAQLSALFKFDPKGELIATLDGKGNLMRPAGIAVTSKGEKIVADMKANKIFLFGKDDTYKGELPGKDFPGEMNMPTYVAVDRNDNVFVTDSLNFAIRVFDHNGRYVRSQGEAGDTPGFFARPKGLALDSDNHLYVLDAIFGNFQIFNQSGQLLLYVGQEGSLPGEMMLPSGIFIDKYDRIYVADTFNHRIQIFQYLKEGTTK